MSEVTVAEIKMANKLWKIITTETGRRQEHHLDPVKCWYIDRGTVGMIKANQYMARNGHAVMELDRNYMRCHLMLFGLRVYEVVNVNTHLEIV